MPSSTSSSDAMTPAETSSDPDSRLTASDRPGVAQPVPVRPVPAQPWARIGLGALVLFALLIGSWEWYWRAFGATPGTQNTDGLWAIQRRRIDNGEGDATVFTGSSRVLFDMQLDVWEKLDGQRPIQLAFEGTTPLPIVEDLAADANFKGRLLIGITPDSFFVGFGRHRGAPKYAQNESPAQRAGQWLSMHAIEPFFAFDDPDFALSTVLRRQDWPLRPGKNWGAAVRKLMVNEPDRNTHLWAKVETDPEYRELARRIWAQDFQPSKDDPPATEIQANAQKQIDRMTKAVTAMRARGVKILFIRCPSGGEYLEYENRKFPRKETWDVLLAATGAPGIHFEDYPELQGLELPEWSHLTLADARKFTAAVHAIVVHDFWMREVVDTN
jgi:hypothetical protein